MASTMSTHDAVLELNRKAGTANFLGAVQTGLQYSMARNSSEQTALQGRMADNLDYMAALQEETLAVEEDISDALDSIDERLGKTNQLIGESIREQRETNKTLRSIEDNAKLTNRLLAAQLRGMGVIAGKIDDSNRIQFASWRDGTDAGKAYREWSKRAGRIVHSIGRYTSRMASARERDFQLNLKALIAQDTSGIMGPWQMPAVPPEPKRPVAPVKPVELQEPTTSFSQYALLSGGGIAVQVIGAIIGAIPGLKWGYGWVSLDGQGFIGTITNFFGFFLALICAVIGGILIGALGYLAGLLLCFLGGWVLWNTDGHSDAWQAWETNRRELEQYKDAERQYQERLRSWEKKHEHWRMHQSADALRRQHQRKIDDFLNECARRAWELVAPETAWSVDNVSYMSTRFSNILKNAPTNPPALGTLPKTRLPILASVGSLPATAPHMRLELAKMIKDNENNPEMRVAMPKAGEDPFAPYPFGRRPKSTGKMGNKGGSSSTAGTPGRVSGAQGLHAANHPQGRRPVPPRAPMPPSPAASQASSPGSSSSPMPSASSTRPPMPPIMHSAPAAPTTSAGQGPVAPPLPPAPLTHSATPPAPPLPPQR